MKKTILITGSTDGIGKLAAITLAQVGHEVILHGRNAEKLAAAIADVEKSAEHANVQGFIADFSDLAAVRQVAEEIKQKVSKIDVLINNAGVFKSPNTFTQKGLDLRLVVNYLAPHLLTEILIPLVEKGTNPRIINLSSAAQAPVSEAALLGDESLSQQESYAQSKLALTMWSFHLAERLKNSAVIAVNPGSLLNTRMVKEAYGHHWSPADKGADILVELATSATHDGVTGKYFNNDQGGYGLAHEDAYNSEKIEALIATTKKITEMAGLE